MKEGTQHKLDELSYYRSKEGKERLDAGWFSVKDLVAFDPKRTYTRYSNALVLE